MREPRDWQDRTSTPRDQPSPDPSGFRPQSPLDQFIATTLSEIQQDQGRLKDRTESIGKKVDELSSAYTLIKGAGIAISVVVPFAAWLLWAAISERFDRLIKLLDERPAQSQQVQPPVQPSGRPR